jgi:hypothetical protein
MRMRKLLTDEIEIRERSDQDVRDWRFAWNGYRLPRPSHMKKAFRVYISEAVGHGRQRPSARNLKNATLGEMLVVDGWSGSPCPGRAVGSGVWEGWEGSGSRVGRMSMKHGWETTHGAVPQEGWRMGIIHSVKSRYAANISTVPYGL